MDRTSWIRASHLISGNVSFVVSVSILKTGAAVGQCFVVTSL